MDIYGFWRSQATFRVRVALNFKGVGFRELPINLDKGEQNDPSFLAVNPLGSVPALLVGERPLTQSLAILEYIEETQPAPPLLPPAALGRARVRALAAVAASDTHPLIVPRVRRYLTEHAGFDAGSWKAWQTQWFTSGLQGLEQRLSMEPETGTYCHGEQVTFADICLVGLVAGIETFGIDVADIPIVRRITEQCRALPAFADAAAARQADYPG